MDPETFQAIVERLEQNRELLPAIESFVEENPGAVHDLWTSEYALVEPMLVAYREGRNVERTVANAKQLVEVRGDVETVLAAASHVEENGFTPLDALHLVRSGDDRIVSSDGADDDFSERLPLEVDG